jgi:hypothetical protein
MTTRVPSADNFAAIRALVSLGQADLLYADDYLYWAEQLLDGVCYRGQYAALCRDRESLGRLTQELRVATEHGDWTQARSVAQRAATTREGMGSTEAVFKIAEAVYSPRMLHVNAKTLALNGVSVASTADLRRERDAVVDSLRLLVAADHQRVGFYRWRLAHFEGLRLACPAEDQARLQYDDVRKRIVTAAQREDFGAVLSLLDSVSTPPAQTHFVGSPGLEPSPTQAEQLIAPFPAAAVARACCLGLSLSNCYRRRRR